jgi:hypothetical protein
MANGKKDDYMAGTPPIGGQYKQKQKLQQDIGSALDRAAESLAGVPGAKKKAFEASKAQGLAGRSEEAYRRRRTPIGSAITKAELDQRQYQQNLLSQTTQMAAEAKQEESVAEMAKASAAETKMGMGQEYEKTLQALNDLEPIRASLMQEFDNWYGADEDGFFETALNYAKELPPHIAEAWFRSRIMPTYAKWGGARANPFTGAIPAHAAATAGGSQVDVGEEIVAPPVG